jgi:hypothetical protein
VHFAFAWLAFNPASEIYGTNPASPQMSRSDRRRRMTRDVVSE